LQPFLLRRIKSEVEKKLKSKIEVNVYVGLSQIQRELYTKILMENKQDEKPHLSFLSLMKCCNHPDLLPEIRDDLPDDIVQNCGKMIVLDKLLAKLKKDGSRVLIFSHLTKMLDILEDYCSHESYSYCRLDDETKNEERKQNIEDFQAPNSDKFLFLLSNRAGGWGITLTSADVVIFYDSHWNPQMESQAIDRTYRIGQEKQVRVFRLITDNTVEVKIIEKAQMKMLLDRLVIQQGRLPDPIESSLTKEEMHAMIRHGWEYVLKSKESDVALDEDIDSIIAKCDSRTRLEESEHLILGEQSMTSPSLHLKPASVYAPVDPWGSGDSPKVKVQDSTSMDRVEFILELIAGKADPILNASDASLTDDTTANSSITDSSSANTPVDSPETTEEIEEFLDESIKGDFILYFF